MPAPCADADFADLTTCGGGACLQHAINRTETGAELGVSPGVWTGTDTDGAAAGNTCTAWTAAGIGQAGVANLADANLTNNFSTANRALTFKLYCFQQA